jgi:hypothetical protein
MKTKTGFYVLENRAGQVVRQIDWQADSLAVVYRHDTGRIQTVSDIKSLDEEGIEYEHMMDVSRAEVEKAPVKVKSFGTLRFVQDITLISPTLDVIEDSEEPLIVSFKWVGSSLAVMLAILLIAGQFLTPEKKEEPMLVTVMERPEEKPVPPPPVPRPEPKRQKKIKMVVAASTKKVRTPHVAKVKTVRKSPTPVRPTMALNQIGALGAFGSLTASKQNGGVKLNAVTTSPGIGRGGSEGSGGMQTAIYGKGLVSAPLGAGQKANGGGGYGTRGKGGGQAGYGTMSLVGSSGAFFQPVESEALVEGGLDRNAIAAVIQRHQGEIRYCYEQGLQTKPHLAGRIAIRFFIGGDGIVTTANISNTSLRSTLVENCITGRLKTWKFPEPKGGVTVRVTYPFVLRRVSDG